MPTEPCFCPYCNTCMTIPADVAPGQRVPCPRCGEAFPYHPRAESRVSQTVASAVRTLPESAAETRTQQRGKNRIIAATVLLVMAVMAAVGIIWAMKTVPDRRSRDRKEPLGYIPGDVDMLGMVQVTRAMESSAGRDFLKTFGLGPGAGAGPIDLEKWTGLRAEDIDQAVLGLKLLDGRIVPRLTLVVETRQPYDTEAILKTLRSTRQVERQGKTLHQFSINHFPAAVWFPTKTILIVGLDPSDFDPVPETPASGISHLPAAIRVLLEDQMSQGAQTIVAADMEEWEKKLAPALLIPLRTMAPPEDMKRWSGVTRVGLWLRFDEAIHLKAAFRCKNEEAAKALHADILKRQWGAPEDVEIAKDVWVLLKTEAAGESVRQIMRRGEGALRK